jgi:hypothetical protein
MAVINYDDKDLQHRIIPRSAVREVNDARNACSNR